MFNELFFSRKDFPVLIVIFLLLRKSADFSFFLWSGELLLNFTKKLEASKRYFPVILKSEAKKNLIYILSDFVGMLRYH